MRCLAPLGCFLVLAAPAAAETARWPVSPPSVRTLVLATGLEQGFVDPLGCNHGAGGAGFRVGFDAWLRHCNPGLEILWVGSGNLSPSVLEGVAEPAEAVYRVLAQVGYRALGVGDEDLLVQGDQLFPLARALDLPLVSANLVIHETGEPVFPPFRIVETRAGRIGFLGITPHLPDFVWADPERGTVVTVPPASVLPRVLADLRPQVDRIALLATQDSLQLADLLAQAPGVDVILNAEGARLLAGPEYERGVPVLWLGALGLGIGRWGLDSAGRTVELRTTTVTADFPGTAFEMPPCPPTGP